MHSIRETGGAYDVEHAVCILALLAGIPNCLIHLSQAWLPLLMIISIPDQIVRIVLSAFLRTGIQDTSRLDQSISCAPLCFQYRCRCLFIVRRALVVV